MADSMTQVTLLSEREHHRRWSADERSTILATAFMPGALVAEAARQFYVSTSLVDEWRRECVDGDDTPGSAPTKSKTDVGRSWVCVRDDRPFGGLAAPAAVFYYSRNRGGVHIREHLDGWSGMLQADAFGGHNTL